MSGAAAPGAPAAADGLVWPAGGARFRLRAYAVCLLAAFGAYALAFAPGAGPLFAALPLAVLAALAFGIAGRSDEARLAACDLGARLAGAAALAVPLGAALFRGTPLPEIVRAETVWPQVLVLVFASRLLSEVTDARFARFWNDPLARGSRNRTQSLLSAFFLGCCLSLLFLQLGSAVSVDPARVDPTAIVLRAFGGRTAIHLAIIVLFFTLLAAIIDAALLSLNDTACLGALKQLCREASAAGGMPARSEVARFARSLRPAFAHSRVIQQVQDLAEPGAPARGRALDDFHAASRRLMRALLSFLPLLGFLGTVIGLTAAIGGLPSGLGPEAKANLDIGASLLGLAVKFETTLLGLLGGLLGTFLLALLEKREGEVIAECRHLMESAPLG
jgi:biopolymer transport protein ExbB/TolQ